MMEWSAELDHIGFADNTDIPDYLDISAKPSSHLLGKSHQWKHQNNVWNMFKVNIKNNKDNRTTSVSLLLTLNIF